MKVVNKTFQLCMAYMPFKKKFENMLHFAINSIPTIIMNRFFFYNQYEPYDNKSSPFITCKCINSLIQWVLRIWFFFSRKAIHSQVHLYRSSNSMTLWVCARVYVCMYSKYVSAIINLILKRLIELADLKIKNKYARNAQNYYWYSLKDLVRPLSQSLFFLFALFHFYFLIVIGYNL